MIHPTRLVATSRHALLNPFSLQNQVCFFIYIRTFFSTKVGVVLCFLFQIKLQPRHLLDHLNVDLELNEASLVFKSLKR